MQTLNNREISLEQDKLLNLALSTYVDASFNNDYMAMIICMTVVYTLENKHAI